MQMTKTVPTNDAEGKSDAEFLRMRDTIQALHDEISKVIVGKKEVVERVIVAALTEGAHVLFEDMPGLAKSVLASSFSQAAGCGFHRVQFTPDLLPTDITGGHMFNRKTNEFEFRPGPIFTNFLLADEINRASPKTQSALLEAMAEKQVSVESVTHKLEPPFIVLATQNPVEQEGTYPLPEAQMDRFAMRLSMGYPTRQEEVEIMTRRIKRHHDAFDTRAVTSQERIIEMQAQVEEVFVDPGIVDYVAHIVDDTRHHNDLVAGSSPRGSLALMKLARAFAAIRGRRYVVPDDIRAFAIPTLAHRLMLTTDARVRGVTQESVMKSILARVPVPRRRGD